MDQDNLNMEIRKFLKKVGISSQRVIENKFYESYKNGLIKKGDEVELEMTLSIKSLKTLNSISSKIKVE